MKIKAKKGCTNPECVMCKKKEHAHKEDVFCPRCGGSLSFVCEKCHTVLADGSTKLCVTCQAKKDDTTEKIINRAKKVGGFVLGLAGVGSGIAAAVKKK